MPACCLPGRHTQSDVDLFSHTPPNGSEPTNCQPHTVVKKPTGRTKVLELSESDILLPLLREGPRASSSQTHTTTTHETKRFVRGCFSLLLAVCFVPDNLWSRTLTSGTGLVWAGCFRGGLPLHHGEHGAGGRERPLGCAPAFCCAFSQSSHHNPGEPPPLACCVGASVSACLWGLCLSRAECRTIAHLTKLQRGREHKVGHQRHIRRTGGCLSRATSRVSLSGLRGRDREGSPSVLRFPLGPCLDRLLPCHRSNCRLQSRETELHFRDALPANQTRAQNTQNTHKAGLCDDDGNVSPDGRTLTGCLRRFGPDRLWDVLRREILLAFQHVCCRADPTKPNETTGRQTPGHGFRLKMRSASIQHLVASQHQPVGPLQKPERCREGSSRTTTRCHQPTLRGEGIILYHWESTGVHPEATVVFLPFCTHTSGAITIPMVI